MPIITDLRDRWERMAPREQRLLMLLALTFTVLGIVGVAMYVRGGLSTLEERNDAMRRALVLIENNKATYLAEKSRRGDPVTMIGDDAPPLATYLESIASEVGVQIPESREGDAEKKGKFTERSLDISLRGVTLTDLGKFLEKVETKSPIIVTQRLRVKTYFNQKDKLDADLTVATYEKAKPEKKKPAVGGAPAEDIDGDGKPDKVEETE